LIFRISCCLFVEEDVEMHKLYREIENEIETIEHEIEKIERVIEKLEIEGSAFQPALNG
jgi:hypothetical protein